jgi:hypothetical protein
VLDESFEPPGPYGAELYELDADAHLLKVVAHHAAQSLSSGSQNLTETSVPRGAPCDVRRK